MKIPADKVAETIIAMVQGLKDAQCTLAKGGITLQYGDEITVEMEVVPADGFNAIERVMTDNSGEQVRLEERPEMVTTSVEDGFVSVTEESAAVTVRTEQRSAKPSIRETVEKPRSRTSTNGAAEEKVVSDSEHTMKEESGQDGIGGNVVISETETEVT